MPYIPPEVVSEIKRIDLLTYLREREPDELVRVSPAAFCTKEHDSLKISNGKWYWWSRGIGGRSALDFLVKVRGMSFLDAAEHLLEGSPAISPARLREPPERAAPPGRQPFRLPRRCADDEAARYLRSRGVSESVAAELMSRGDVYGTLRKGSPHAVFVGRDPSGAPRYAALRSCRGSYKGEAPGSDKRFAFSLPGGRPDGRLHVFESAIDALSFTTIVEIEGGEWRGRAMLSLGGVAVPRSADGGPGLPAPLRQYLDDHGGDVREVRLHLDNDDAGKSAATAVARALEARGGPARIAHPPAGKDVNEFLTTRYSRGARADAGRAR